MKLKITSLLLSSLLLLSLFSGCSDLPDAAVEVLPESMVTALEESSASISQTDIVDAAYSLGNMEVLEGEQRLTGTVTEIVTRYNSKYDNVTVEMTVEGRENRPVQCFRLEGPGVQDLRPGDEITVVGQLLNYNGIIEFTEGCYLEFFILGDHPIEEETEAAENCTDSAEAVAAYIHTYGCLPEFYMTKNEARVLYGWEGGALDNLAPGMAIGGDTFRNYEGQLPDAPGRYYTECDIGTIGNGARGAKRIVFSNDGLIFYTEDHYETFELLYGEP